jgi:hypothetical protein
LKISPRQAEVVTPTSTQPQETLEDFLYSQEPWIVDLLRHLNFKVSFAEAITSLTASTTTNLGATWGWALSPPTGNELIECKGPAYGIVMDSYRAEAYGLLSITTLVTLLKQYTTNTFAPIELLCDNNALVTKIEKLRNSTRPEFEKLNNARIPE